MVGALILGVISMAGAQVSGEVPLQSQGQPEGQEQPQDQGQPQGQAQADPRSSVARISSIHGDVSTQRGDSGDGRPRR